VRRTWVVPAHCLAEVHSVVTGMPGKNRASPDEAMPLLRDVHDRLTTVTLNMSAFWRTLPHPALSAAAMQSLQAAH
jgi:hypothetical protein